MIILRFIRVLTALIMVGANVELKPGLHNFEEYCNRLTIEPYFEPEMVIGKPWRIYYSWNMQLDEKCLDMIYRNVTTEIVNRVFNDMYEYLETQPFWDAATLLVSMGQSHHEMLLFADQGAAGRFVGVPNVVRDGNITPNKNSVPLFKIQMKLFHGGKYLVMSDCNIGVSTLSVRLDRAVNRAEIAVLASTLGLGQGYAACISENTNEDLFLKWQ